MMYDEEAVYQDADIEQAEMEREGAHIAALEARGVCTHGSTVGYAENPATGKPYYPEQVGLVGDQRRCMDCGEVFADEEAHTQARAFVVGR